MRTIPERFKVGDPVTTFIGVYKNLPGKITSMKEGIPHLDYCCHIIVDFGNDQSGCYAEKELTMFFNLGDNVNLGRLKPKQGYVYDLMGKIIGGRNYREHCIIKVKTPTGFVFNIKKNGRFINKQGHLKKIKYLEDYL